MQRITITIDDDLLDAVDRLSERRGYQSRSEAVRDIVRGALLGDPTRPDADEVCLAALTYVFEHDKRDLARRLTNAQHDHHAMSVATLHVHLGQHDCLEVAILRGHPADLRAFSDEVTTQRGVRHGHLQLLPLPADAAADHAQTHSHDIKEPRPISRRHG